MIRLVPPTDSKHPNHKKIMDLYWYMAARVLPFYPEDIFPYKTFYWLEKVWKVEEFYDTYFLNAEIDYDDALKKREKKKTDRKEKAENARKCINENARFLYDFLYEGQKADGHVKRENLKKLLCNPVNSREWEGWLEKYDFAGKDKIRARQELEKIFDYKSFSSLCDGDEKLIHRLIVMLNVEICPYCNRNYITTYQYGRQSEMDHFWPKSRYPYFGISLLNLIPCCKPCNHGKGEKVAGLYPYSEGFGKDINFVTRPQKGLNVSAK